jgi:cytochrome c5
MSEIKIQEHSSPIKTPAQLIVVVVLAFVIPIALIVIITQLVTSGGPGQDHPAMSEEAIAKRIQPVGKVAIDPDQPKPEAGAAPVDVPRTGAQIVQAQCGKCHEKGEMGAPRIADREAWVKRIAKGVEPVILAALRGHDGMPARGGLAELTDAEFKSAVMYMLSTGAGKALEPPAGAAVAKADAGKGQAVYKASCTVCHAAGVAGAPKTGDKAAWAPRLKTGMDALYASSIKGKGAMPPKGGNLALSDDDVKAAVDYMVGQAK